MGRPRVTDVSQLRVKYKPVARCVGTKKGKPCERHFMAGNHLFSTLTASQVRAEARNHAFDHPGHRVHVDVLDRETFEYTPITAVDRAPSQVRDGD